MKRLIVNADDFGLTRGVNNAIVECHHRGIVTSTTLMATGAAFGDAVSLSRTLPGLSVGCHVVLVDGEPLSSPSLVRSLLAPGTSRFYQSIDEFARAALSGRFQAAEIEIEATAQFQRLRQAGVHISHFDAHKHVHMFPSVIAPVLRAAKSGGITIVRNPFEYPRSMRLGSVLSDRKLAIRYAEVLLLRSFRRNFMRQVRQAGFATPDGSLGVAATGSLSTKMLTELMERMPRGTWELVCHPGYNDTDLQTIQTKLRASRAIELEALSDSRALAVAERLGIQLLSFAELAPHAPATS